jgi:hypothetical protein
MQSNRYRVAKAASNALDGLIGSPNAFVARRRNSRRWSPDHRRRRNHHRGCRLRTARADGLSSRARARRRRRQRTSRSRVGRRWLLVKQSHRCAPGTRHDTDRRSRHDAQPTAKDTPRWSLRLHAKSDRHRARWRSLLTKTVHGRAGLRPDQVEPTDRALQTTRPGGRTLGMAPDHRHSQPSEAPPALFAGGNRTTPRTSGPFNGVGSTNSWG